MADAAEVGEPECYDTGVFAAGQDVVDAGLGRDGVATEGVFAVEGCYDEAGVEEGGAEVPEGGGEFAGLGGCVLAYVDVGGGMCEDKGGDKGGKGGLV